ncbi:MAG TPA: hypothetical protein VGN26_06825 [Armatimonadota bacterium]
MGPQQSPHDPRIDALSRPEYSVFRRDHSAVKLRSDHRHSPVNGVDVADNDVTLPHSVQLGVCAVRGQDLVCCFSDTIVPNTQWCYQLFCLTSQQYFPVTRIVRMVLKRFVGTDVSIDSRVVISVERIY